MWVSEWSSPWHMAGGVACACVASLALGAVLLLAALKLYLVWTCGVCRSRASLSGKTALVTGASRGIGLETARDLARRGARVLLACRDAAAAEAARAELVQDTGNTDVHVVALDLASLRSVRECAAHVLRSERALHVLVHNAGTAETRARATPDGLEATMATNHFGPFLLTLLLGGLLRRTQGGARVVVVASGLHCLAPVDVSARSLNPEPQRLYVPVYQYYRSKLVNIVWAAELARRFHDTAVTVNCLHPGMVRTDIYRHVWAPLRWPLQLIIHAFFKTAEQGAQTSVHCAVSERLAGVTGRYFSDCRQYYIPRGLDDPHLGKKLWELSEQLVNLQPDDPKL